MAKDTKLDQLARVRLFSACSKKELTTIVRVPFGVTNDHAEGLSLVTAAPLSVMVCYDSPAATRMEGSGVKADIFAIDA